VKSAAPKKVWGSTQGRGGATRSEKAYLAATNNAYHAGIKAADHPNASPEWCPAKLSEDEQWYWREGFRRARKVERV
jgi:hypothetical protein